MPEGNKKPKRRFYDRHLREEAVVINGTTIIFYRDLKKRRWNWRAFDAQVTLPNSTRPDNTSACSNEAEK